MSPFIDIHTHKAKSEFDLQIVNQSWPLTDQGFISIGIHPWNIDNVDLEAAIEQINIAINQKNVLALGECGIDRAIKIPVNVQTDWFIKQATMAEQAHLPVIIHCVRASSDFLQIRSRNHYHQPWIFHGFNGNKSIAIQLIKVNGYLSFGRALLKSEKLQSVFVDLPMSNIFFETDNDETINVEAIYQFAAKLRHICIEELKEQIYINFKKVFTRYGDGMA